jgi:hypothetical protein
MPPLIRGAPSLKDLAKPQLESNALEDAEARLEELRERRRRIQDALDGKKNAPSRADLRKDTFDPMYQAAEILAAEVDAVWQDDYEDAPATSPKKLMWALNYVRSLSAPALGVHHAALRDLPDDRHPCVTREGYEETLKELCGEQEPGEVLALVEKKILGAMDAVAAAMGAAAEAQILHIEGSRDCIFLDPKIYSNSSVVLNYLRQEVGFLGGAIEHKYSPFIPLYISGHPRAQELRSAVLRDNIAEVFEVHHSTRHAWAPMFRDEMIRQLVREAETVVLVASPDQLEQIRRMINSRRVWVILRDLS